MFKEIKERWATLANATIIGGVTLLSVPGKIFNRIILERIQDALDVKLHGQQDGFMKNRPCMDQTAASHIITEELLEWTSPPLIKFLDYQKAFDSVDRETL